MTRQAGDVEIAQAYVELLSDDPEAVSAETIARERLAAGARLKSLRRLRFFEIRGPLPGRAALEELLHRSTQFYNPAKERCRVRIATDDATPFDADEPIALVAPRGAERRGAAERWWRHETGSRVQVREGIVWAFAFEPGTPAASERALELTELRDRSRGLLCNPHAQSCRFAEGSPPMPWFGLPRAGAAKGRKTR